MNIAVINIKDIFKYVIKMGIILFLIYLCVQIVKGSNITISKQKN